MTTDLEAALAAVERALTNDTNRNVFRLPANSSRLLALLLASDRVPAEIIRTALTTKSEPKIAVKWLRQYLAPFGIAIKSIRNEGYFLDPDMKARVRQYITCGVIPKGNDQYDPAPAPKEEAHDVHHDLTPESDSGERRAA